MRKLIIATALLVGLGLALLLVARSDESGAQQAGSQQQEATHHRDYPHRSGFDAVWGPDQGVSEVPPGSEYRAVLRSGVDDGET